ncbi:hypothetical protein F9881_20005, partial [Morganella morganii]|nr:hypothetical protein [Morganella morganii]
QKLDLYDLPVYTVQKECAALFCSQPNPPFDKGELNRRILEDTRTCVQTQQSRAFYYDIRNTDRSVGAALSGFVAELYGNSGIAASPPKLHFTGTAVQSFGVWNAAGIELTLTCDAYVYVLKAMAGLQVVLHPSPGSAFAAHHFTISGNTFLYGSTARTHHAPCPPCVSLPVIYFAHLSAV